MSDLHVAAFTQGVDVPSARFRVRQYLPALTLQGIRLDEYPARFGSYPPPGVSARFAWLPRALRERAATVRHARADVALVQREMVSTLATAECLWRGPLVFDVDDAVWLHQRMRGVDRIARRSRMVICGNSYIAEHFASQAATVVLPTAVDAERYLPGSRAERPLICWSGSASGLPYLNALAPQLARVMEAVPEARLRVICNAPPTLLGVPHVEYVPWSPDTEVSALQGAWAGLMPMPDTPWTRGKCSYKMLSYMSCAVPALASPHGMNAEVIAQGEGAIGVRDDEWTDALVALLRSPERVERMGWMGRETVLARYALDVVALRLAKILKGAA